MNLPVPIFVGYFPKITARKTDLKMENGEVWIKNDIVEEICSVSGCCSKGPADWIDKWQHNDLGFYDTEELALSVIPTRKQDYDLYAYKIYPLKFIDGQARPYEIKSTAVEKLDHYRFIGYDIVNKIDIVDFFECSALSCGCGWEEYPVNKYCLMEKLEEAYQACLEIEQGKFEPGPYYLFEVFRRE